MKKRRCISVYHSNRQTYVKHTAKTNSLQQQESQIIKIGGLGFLLLLCGLYQSTDASFYDWEPPIFKNKFSERIFLKIRIIHNDNLL